MSRAWHALPMHPLRHASHVWGAFEFVELHNTNHTELKSLLVVQFTSAFSPAVSKLQFRGISLVAPLNHQVGISTWERPPVLQLSRIGCTRRALKDCVSSCLSLQLSYLHYSRLKAVKLKNLAGALSSWRLFRNLLIGGFSLAAGAGLCHFAAEVRTSKASPEMAKEPSVRGPGWSSAAASSSSSSSSSSTKDERPAPVRTELYPHREPTRSGRLKVGDGHELYWEESGNPKGKPALFLHGGPGGGTSAANRRFFDPRFYRLILMDQRGSGKSTPHAAVENNTTWDLVADIERLREELKVDKWLVFGGSWGSTLSLSYAETHPDRVSGLILRGIFMLRKKEITWFYQSGADTVFPDAWEAYRDFIPEEERGDFVAAYHKRLMDESNPDVQMAAAKAWTGWEMSTSYLIPNQDSVRRGEDDRFALAFAKIENHYFFNKGFFETDEWLLESVHKIRHIPGIIIQGRYDMVCPMMSAWDLHRAWPEATFKVVTNAGHSANEPGISAELVAAVERFKAVC